MYTECIIILKVWAIWSPSEAFEYEFRAKFWLNWQFWGLIVRRNKKKVEFKDLFIYWSTKLFFMKCSNLSRYLINCHSKYLLFRSEAPLQLTLSVCLYTVSCSFSTWQFFIDLVYIVYKRKHSFFLGNEPSFPLPSSPWITPFINA